MCNDFTEVQKHDAMLRAAEAGDICTECFACIPSDAPVAIMHFWSVVDTVYIPRKGGGFWKHRYERIDLPICLDCASSAHSTENNFAESGHCDTCDCEIRHWEFAVRLPSACCTNCKRLASNKRSCERRRVTQEAKTCVVFGETFTPGMLHAAGCE